MKSLNDVPVKLVVTLLAISFPATLVSVFIGADKFAGWYWNRQLRKY